MAKKERMGSGLDMLFEDNFHDEEEASQAIRTLRISFIEPDKNQPRKNFDEEKLRELADNISEHGILQPILVRPIGGGSYKIVAGERRWRAARMAGLTELPVVIRELDDDQAAQIALIENIQREDLDPIEEAKAYRRLTDDFGMTQEQVARSVGKSRSGIANAVRLLSLPDDVQELVSDGRISVGHAKILCGIDNEVTLTSLTALAASGASVRELENQLAVIKSGSEKDPPPKKEPKVKTEDISEPFKKYSIETEMSFKQLLGIDAKVARDKTGYSLKLNFKSEADLKDMIAQLADKLG